MRKVFLPLIAFGMLAMVPAALFAADDDEAKALANEITGKGAMMFATKDAGAMAETYTEDAKIVVELKDESNGQLVEKVYNGRSEIRGLYEDIFKGSEPISSTSNQVDYARRLGEDVLIIVGTFSASQGSQAHRYPFIQVRQKRGDKWLMTSLRVFALPGS